MSKKQTAKRAKFRWKETSMFQGGVVNLTKGTVEWPDGKGRPLTQEEIKGLLS